MSMQFYSVNTGPQTAMGGTHLHSPQSIFQHTMSPPSTNLQSETPWFEVPHVPPMSMPWSLPSSQKPDLVCLKGYQTFFKGSCKRKLETPDLVDMRPNKQLITEEKMAQHFRGLHISPNSTKVDEAGPSTSTVKCNLNLEQSNSIDLDLASSLDSDKINCKSRLIISDEIKRLQQEPILPTSLVTQSLSKLERPTMALVLWEPPSRHMPMFSRDTPAPAPSFDDNNNSSSHTGNANNNENNSNNNNDGIPDLNQTVNAINTVSILEPMDL